MDLSAHSVDASTSLQTDIRPHVPAASDTDSGETVSLPRRCAVATSSIILTAVLFYTSGLNALVIIIMQQCGVLPSETFFRIMYPFTHAKFHPAPDGTFDMINVNYFAIAIPFFLVSIAMEAFLIHIVLPPCWRPLHGYRLNDTISSVSLGLLMLLMGQIVFLEWSKVFYRLIYETARVSDSFSDPNDPLAFWLSFVVHDCLYYIYHRVSHWISWLWMSHVVHHSSEEYNLSTALRQPANFPFTPETFVSTLTMAFFFPSELVILHGQVGLLWQFWIHTQLVPPLPKVELFLNTAALHRVHHARNHNRLGKNYGSFFILWDRLGGTFEDERKYSDDIHYGIIPPLNSWNPLWANLHHLHDMVFRQLKWNGWTTPFVHWTPPGGKCPKLGSRLNPFTKFDAFPSTRPVQALVIFEFLVVLTCGAGIVVLAPSTAWLQELTGAGEMIVSNMYHSAIFVVVLVSLCSAACLESAKSWPDLRTALVWDGVRVATIMSIGVGLLVATKITNIVPFVACAMYACLHVGVIAGIFRYHAPKADAPRGLAECRI